MKKKLNLTDLEINSFVTSIQDAESKDAIKGGDLDLLRTLGIPCIPSYTCAESRPPAMCYPQ